MSSTAVPTIDIGPYRLDRSGKADVGRAVDRACREIGFLVITGHGVDPRLCERMFSLSKEFFDLPQGEKEKVERWADHIPRGYGALGDESLAYAKDPNQPGPPDLKQSFTIGPIDVPDDEYHHREQAGAHFEPNRWPERPAELREVWETYYRVMERLSSDLMSLFALALQLPENFFDDKIDKHISCLRVLDYPPQLREPQPDQLRAGVHSDYGTLTIVRHEENRSAGLQVCNPKGEWVDVPVVPDSFVVNIGDLMARWTNDRWVSTLHRVVNPPRERAADDRRLTIAFFGEPNYDAVAACLPSCRDRDHPPKYPPVTAGDHLRMQFTRQTTFEGEPKPEETT